MITFPLYEFTGSLMHKVFGQDVFTVYINELDPNPADADWYVSLNGNLNWNMGVDVSNTAMIERMYGGKIDEISFSFGTKPENTEGNVVLSVFPNGLPNTVTYRNKAWMNPRNGWCIVGYSHYHTVHSNYDVTFDTTLQSGPDIQSSTFREVNFSSANKPSFIVYDNWGGYVGGVKLRNIYFIRPGQTMETNGLTGMGMIAPKTYEQEPRVGYYTQYYHADGTPWLDGETHVSMQTSTFYRPDQFQCSLTKYNGSDEWWVNCLLVASPLTDQTILWNGVLSDEMYFRGHYHYFGWFYNSSGQWRKYWARNPYLFKPGGM